MFWQGRHTFLTGHTGFKGAWLSLWLEQLGARVTGFSLAPPTTPSLFAEASVASSITSIAGDIRDLPSLRQAMQQAEPEVVFHLAAQALVRASYADPVATYATNVIGTVHLLEAARACPSVRAIVIITSDKCYENLGRSRPFRESDPLGGQDPYSNSKACTELVAACYRNSFFSPESYAHHRVAIATARAGNVIGGGDWASARLLPDAVRAFTAGTSLLIRNPHSTRPWQHVLDPLRGYLTLAQALLEAGPQPGHAWNFGPDPDAVQTVASVIREFSLAWNSYAHQAACWELDPGPHPYEADTLSLDCTLAHSRLGWHPALSCSESIDLSAQWYTRHLAGESARALCLEQLTGYPPASPLGPPPPFPRSEDGSAADRL